MRLFVKLVVALVSQLTNLGFHPQAVGEPPLLLAASVFFAIKSAVAAAREQNGITGPFRMDGPATPDRVRLACAGDKILGMLK